MARVFLPLLWIIGYSCVVRLDYSSYVWHAALAYFHVDFLSELE